jgi:quinol monooxygenase YgiN
MIILYVSVNTSDENRQIFVDRLRNVVLLAKDRIGCLKYEWFQDHADDNHFVVCGEFDTADNFTLYKKSPVVSSIGTLLLPLLRKKPSFKHFKGQIIEQS